MLYKTLLSITAPSWSAASSLATETFLRMREGLKSCLALPHIADSDLSTQLARAPHRALPWLIFISDSTACLPATKNLAHPWLKIEPAAGQSWVTQGSRLPPDQQTKVLENAGEDFVDYIYNDHTKNRWPTR